MSITLLKSCTPPHLLKRRISLSDLRRRIVLQTFVFNGEFFLALRVPENDGVARRVQLLRSRHQQGFRVLLGDHE